MHSDQKILTAFFSMTKDYSFGNTKRIVKGHTEQVAEQIAEITGSALYRINKTEALKPENVYVPKPVENFEQYEIIYLGFPIYYHTMPKQVYEFLKSYPFENKTIIPFTTHAGSGLGRSVAEIRSTCAESFVLDGLAVGSAEVQSAKQKIRDWTLGSLETAKKGLH